MWIQRPLKLSAYPRGFHLITDQVRQAVPELRQFRAGMLSVFIQHTSASLTINENADPDVRHDFELVANHLVPESLPYTHTLEGRDDMPAHVKASLLSQNVIIPVGDGKLQLGTWQGIYLCEHRNHAEGRRLVLTLWGEPSN